MVITLKILPGLYEFLFIFSLRSLRRDKLICKDKVHKIYIRWILLNNKHTVGKVT